MSLTNYTKIPRPEYPKMQFKRENWRNLNGEWNYELDDSCSGIERKLFEERDAFPKKIIVPFAPQSALSGVECKDFIRGIWYQKKVDITAKELEGVIRLHFGAVDYEAMLYVNGSLVGSHRGGYSSFSFDIEKFVNVGENTITLFVMDDERNPLIPRGKQSELYYSHKCDYTRTTGIWQTVWLEFFPKVHISSVKYYPDYKNATVTMKVVLKGSENLDINVSFNGAQMADYHECDCTGVKRVTLHLAEKHLWEIGNGRLYDVTLKFGKDTVQSYFGLRNVELKGDMFLLNGKSVFQRLVLDQGYYPDGIYTAPTDEALKKDIELSLSCGFNGARPHQKIFEERYFYHCDKLGYIVWGEYPDWGLDASNPENIYSIMPEWLEEMERDFNHPAIIGWCPRNEVWGQNGRAPHKPSIKLLYDVTKCMDNTRPCIDTSGGFHVETDIYDLHDYNQNPQKFKENYDRIMTENVLHDYFATKQHYSGQPLFMSEYGGFKWSSDTNGAWGYGDAPKTAEEFIERFKNLSFAIMQNNRFMGFCYTQLTDVEQETNGLFYYDRTPKFDCNKLKEIISKPAAIERGND